MRHRRYLGMWFLWGVLLGALIVIMWSENAQAYVDSFLVFGPVDNTIYAIKVNTMTGNEWSNDDDIWVGQVMACNEANYQTGTLNNFYSLMDDQIHFTSYQDLMRYCQQSIYIMAGKIVRIHPDGWTNNQNEGYDAGMGWVEQENHLYYFKAISGLLLALIFITGYRVYL